MWTDNNIETDGVRVISEALKTNTSLKLLNMSCEKKGKKKMMWQKGKWMNIVRGYAIERR